MELKGKHVYAVVLKVLGIHYMELKETKTLSPEERARRIHYMELKVSL